MIDRSRHLRQVLVPGIGESGQARIAGAVLPVAGDGLAHETATTYALAAGAKGVVRGDLTATRVPPWVESEAAAQVLAGARGALAAIRAALS